MPLELDIDRRVRHAVYQHFAEWARAPDARALSHKLHEKVGTIEASWKRLESDHLLVLAPTGARIWMAHPFSAIPTQFVVVARGRTYYANCAWDALAIPSLLEADAQIDAACADCGQAVRFQIALGRVEEKLRAWIVHFAVPVKQFWENIGFT